MMCFSVDSIHRSEEMLVAASKIRLSMKRHVFLVLNRFI